MSAVSHPALLLERLSVGFGDQAGLREISLAMQPAERLVLLGPSGAGKTTLLRAIAGLASTTSGRITIGGREVTTRPPERRGAVYLHQTPLLFPHLNVGENIAFAPRLKGAARPAREAAVRSVAAQLGLDALLERRVQTLSGGQKHRVALARALVADAPVILLDEPLSALDPALRQEVREALLAASGGSEAPAQLIVTHDLDDAGLLGHRVGILLEGSLVQLSSPTELFGRPASAAVARYLGWPTLLNGTLQADGTVRCALGRVRPGRTIIERAEPGMPVLVAARADALIAATEGAVAGELIGLRVRSSGITGAVRLGDDVVECVGVAAPVRGELRLRVREELLHLFPSPGRERP